MSFRLSHHERVALTSLCLVSVPVSACGSSESSNPSTASGGVTVNATSVGGTSSAATSSGGTGNGGASSQSTASSATVGCKQWPLAKLPQFAGMSFYGTETGPCRATHAERFADDATPYINTVTHLTYDGEGRLMGTVTEVAGTGELSECSCVWDSNVLKTRTCSTDRTVFLTDQFEYGSSTVVSTTLRTNTDTANVQIALVLTPEGYPSTAAVGFDEDHTGKYVVERYDHYEYVDCRLQKRCQGATATELEACTDFTTYEYDAAGRIISSTVSTDTFFGTLLMTDTFDYDCEHEDAGP